MLTIRRSDRYYDATAEREAPRAADHSYRPREYESRYDEEDRGYVRGWRGAEHDEDYYGRRLEGITPEYKNRLWEDLSGTVARESESYRREAQRGYRDERGDYRREEAESRRIRKQDEVGTYDEFVASHRNYSLDTVQVNRSSMLNKKGIAIIAAYFMIVAIIALVILMSVGAFSGMVGGTSAGEDTNLSVGADVNSAAGLQDSVYYQNNTKVILADGSAAEINLIPLSEENTYEEESNWFDQACDWLSNLVGG